MSPRFHSVPPAPGVPAAVSPTFLSSTAFRGEDDENRQEKRPGPCRSHAHHYRSAHSSLQSECIMLASAPAAPLQPVRGDNAESNPWALYAGGPPTMSSLSFLF